MDCQHMNDYQYKTHLKHIWSMSHIACCSNWVEEGCKYNHCSQTCWCQGGANDGPGLCKAHHRGGRRCK